jgi:DNA ligase-associated metallophosphoesterase
MNVNAFQTNWAGESLALLPERALWWPRQKTLFIADPHFGKAAAFRFAGIAVPETSQEDDLARLEKIVLEHAAERLVILGDFFHAKSGRSENTLHALKTWRERNADLETILIRGNHDRHAGSPPEEWNIRCVAEPWKLGPFECRHHPPEKITSRFVLTGHLHPAIQIRGRGGMKARCRCFYLQKNAAVLPAFGSFTGAQTIRPQAGEKVYLLADGEIIDASRLFTPNLEMTAKSPTPRQR